MCPTHPNRQPLLQNSPPQRATSDKLPSPRRADAPVNVEAMFSAPALASQPPPQGAAWPELRHRMRHHLLLKATGISVFMWVFFLGYFHTLRHPVRPAFEMPLTALDHAITFQPLAFWAYVSLWLYVGIPAGLMLSLRSLLVYGAWAAALCLTGLLIFYLWPTAVPKPELPADIASHPGFALLQGVDAAGNACPSLHVATALFSALWIHHLLRQMRLPGWMAVFNVVWLVLIVYSTLAIKQHVALDAVAGVLLGAAFAWASLRWFPREPAWRPSVVSAPVAAGAGR
jgi:hypothetical protein